jgi:hypothetical protein
MNVIRQTAQNVLAYSVQRWLERDLEPLDYLLQDCLADLYQRYAADHIVQRMMA